ncbi:hypothetical protein MSNKSG1_01528 [Marinobacter santoriniensis NKSG1]|uniref:Uncharacterized protein n=1 Tax=Marinobacter santoriniensis NKSG1 TaxID=1288826 RepID=M7DHV7_9GAMM|nr:hypothetical protein MSNKSG1_01528 [Marinobacter santoriniensis NKSG1]
MRQEIADAPVKIRGIAIFQQSEQRQLPVASSLKPDFRLASPIFRPGQNPFLLPGIQGAQPGFNALHGPFGPGTGLVIRRALKIRLLHFPVFVRHISAQLGHLLITERGQ